MEAVKRYDGKWQCQTRVFSGERCDTRGHMCSRQANFDPDANGNPTKCKIHSEEGVRKKQKEADERYRLYCEKMAARERAANAQFSAVEIVRKIADGHNDPRGLCLQWLSDFK